MKKRPDITERTKANLITAFCKILENKRIDKITVKEITDKAGYYRSTFYQYFTDISELMDYVENILIEDIKKQTLYNLSNNSIDDLILKSVSFFDNDSQYLPILFGNNANPAFFSKLKNILRPIILEYYHLETDNNQSDYLIELVLSALYGVLTYWFQNNKNITVQELVNIVSPTIKSMINNWIMTLES